MQRVVRTQISRSWSRII